VFFVGPRLCGDLAAASAELARVANDRSLWVPDPQTGRRGPTSVVLEGSPGVCYADMTAAADACRAAGLGDIRLAGPAR
jgi:hypothetical protein